jgi:hypothetical protein
MEATEKHQKEGEDAEGRKRMRRKGILDIKYFIIFLILKLFFCIIIVALN